MFARLKAWLGLDGKNFSKEVDDAKNKSKGLGSAFKSLKQVISAAIPIVLLRGAVSAISDFVTKAKEARDFRLISEDDINAFKNIESSFASVLDNTKAKMATFISEAIGGWYVISQKAKAFFKGEDVDQAAIDAYNKITADNTKPKEEAVKAAKQEKEKSATKEWMEQRRKDEEQRHQEEVDHARIMEGHRQRGIEKAKEEAEQLADAKKKAEEEAAKKRQKQLEDERTQIEKNHEAMLNAIDAEIEAIRERGAASEESFSNNRTLATDAEARKKAKQQERIEQQEEKRFQFLLNRAHRKISKSRQGFTSATLTESERFALRAEMDRRNATQDKSTVAGLEKKRDQLNERATAALEKIESKIDKLLEMT